MRNFTNLSQSAYFKPNYTPLNLNKSKQSDQAMPLPFLFTFALHFPLRNVNEISMSHFLAIRARLSNIIGKSLTPRLPQDSPLQS